jgi:threonylcarbamoyladenosine tRNA methylthiotransferase MtaB
LRETSTIARQLTDAGYDKVSFDDKADVYVINTCSVTENADRECKLHVKRAMKSNPEGLVVIVGCYAQLKPEEISQIDGVDLVLGAKEKFNILSYLDDLEKSDSEGIVHSCEIEETDFFIGSYSIGDRTRAFLKVQDGCDYKCTYCTIPLARGISRSDTIENVLQNAKEIAGRDIKEIVLTGVNIGDYGKGEFGNKRHEHTFLDLISELDKVDGIERIRISSIEPNLLKDESIELVSKSKSFVPHFHIPLQSGCDDLLKKMKRRYLTKLYNDRVNKIREVMPDAAIGVDVIVGFPGETEEKFMETYNFLNELPITYLHVFTYSERENTEAVDMDGIVPIPERKKRNKMLRILSEKKKMAFYETQLGKTLPVLWEHENKDGKMYGFTENYVRVQKDFDSAFVNQIEFLNLEKILSDGTVSVQSSFESFLAKA